MAEHGDGTLKAVVIYEGDLHDPEFPKKFRSLLSKLKTILDQPARKKKSIRVKKVEPWNSVRVTLSIPKEAAQRLRQLAAEGNTALRALGILSVQLEGDTVISLRLVGQEILLRSENDNTNSSDEPSVSHFGNLSNVLESVPMQVSHQSMQSLTAGNNQPSTSNSMGHMRTSDCTDTTMKSGIVDQKPIFKSPNMVCPMDGKLPTPVPANVADIREFPFESMIQARVIHRRENTMAMTGSTSLSNNLLPTIQSQMNATSPFTTPTPPPPYPAMTGGITASSGILNKSPSNHLMSAPGNIVISSPLLVNLLQNETTPTKNSKLLPSVGSNVALSIVRNTAQSSSQENVEVKTGYINSGKNQNKSNDNNNNHNHANDINGSHNISSSVSIAKQINANYIGGNTDNIMNSMAIQNSRNNTHSSNAKDTSEEENHLSNNDLATKSNFQEFARYQMQYNLSQQQNDSQNSNSGVEQLSDLDEITKHDLDSLLPGLNDADLDSALGLDVKDFVGIIGTSLDKKSGPVIPSDLRNEKSVAELNTEIQPNTGKESQQIFLEKTGKQPQFLINPLTGELEPMQVIETDNDSEAGSLLFNSGILNSIYSDEENSSSTCSSNTLSKHSDNERLNNPESLTKSKRSLECIDFGMRNKTVKDRFCLKNSLLKEKLQIELKNKLLNRCLTSKPHVSKEKSKMQIGAGISESRDRSTPEKIELKLKLGKSEPITRPYKRDVDSGDSKLQLASTVENTGKTASAAINTTIVPSFYNMVTHVNNNSQSSANKEGLRLLSDLNNSDLDTALVNIINSSNLKNESILACSNKMNESELAAIKEQIESRLMKEKDPIQLKSDRATNQIHEGKAGKQPQFLINPLTGELEPMQGSIYSNEEKSCSFSNSFSECSDMERSNNSENSTESVQSFKSKVREDFSKKNKTVKDKVCSKSSSLQNKLQMGLKNKNLNKCLTSIHVSKEKSKMQVSAAIAESGDRSTPEKIELKLKLGKSEPITRTYGRGADFGASKLKTPSTIENTARTASSTNSVSLYTNNEELRVPPLHISLRGGRNSIVIKNKKNRIKAHSMSDESLKKSNTNENSSASKPVGAASDCQTSCDLDNSINQTDIRSQHLSDARIKTHTQTHLLEKFKQKFGEDRSTTSTTGNIETRPQEQLHASLQHMEAVETNKVEVDKQSPNDTSCTLNDTLHLETTTGNSSCNLVNMSNSLNTSSSMPSTVLDDEENKGLIKSTTNELSNVSKTPKNNNDSSGSVNTHAERLNCMIKNNTVKSISYDSSLSAPRDPFEDERTNVINMKPKSLDNVTFSINQQIPQQEKLSDLNEIAKEIICNESSESPDITKIAISNQHSEGMDIIKNRGSVNQYTNKCNNQTPLNIKSLSDCDAVKTVTSTIQSVRQSSSSRAYGEDSGIETIDTLSEKNPHQMTTPHAETKHADNLKETPNATVSPLKQENSIDSAIAGMVSTDTGNYRAKMNEYEATVCDNDAAPCVNSKEQTLAEENEDIKLKADTNVRIEKIATDAESIKDEVLLSGLTQKTKSEASVNVENVQSRNIEENNLEIPEKIVENDSPTKSEVHEAQHIEIASNDVINITTLRQENEAAKVIEEGLGNKQVQLMLNKLDTKNLSDDRKKSTTTTEGEQSTLEIKKELKKEVEENDEEEKNDKEVENIVAESDKFLKTNSDASNLLPIPSNEDKEALAQLSIEIPTNDIEGLQRIRTRASSKLESPLDVIAKQSPNDLMAKPPKLCSATVENLSPKTSDKSLKRKRQGSESSTQSSVSDDSSTRNKRQRKSIDSRASESTSPTMISTSATVEARSAISSSLSSSSSSLSYVKPTKNISNSHVNSSDDSQNKADDSSDSDEPLIEIAGKVRSSKLMKIETEKAHRIQQKVILNTTINNQLANAIHKSDDKLTVMGTRRSNRMNAGTKGNEYNKKTGSIGVVGESDGRRKTRNAGFDPEGRRRRSSRDIK